MESNRDEADKCLELAMKYIRNGNKDKAERFVRKAEKLFPSRRIQEVLNLVERMGEEEAGHREESKSRERRERSSEQHDNEEASTSRAPRNFTQDQVEAVKRVRRCKNYYEILGLAKEANEADLKKSYRKLALAFHPDKNKAPGASEAFKAIGNAYAVLSDDGKRRQYDLYGSDEDQAARSSGSGRRSHRGGFYEHEDPSHGFQGDMTAEEIFNMFFGGGMPGSSVYVRRGGRWQRGGGGVGEQPAGHQQAHHHHQQGDTNGFSAVFQLLPILLLVLVSMLSSLLVSDPLYSLEPSHKFHIKRITGNLAVSFYVKDNFRTEYTGSLRKLERQIEEEYIQHLRNNCFREKSYKENLLWQARYSGNNHLLNKAHNYPTPSCGSLEKMYASAA